jgi:hypothetical protein
MSVLELRSATIVLETINDERFDDVSMSVSAHSIQVSKKD